MNHRQLQDRLGVNVDGDFGRKSKAALIARFANREAPALTRADIERAADRLGVRYAVLAALREKEVGGRSSFSVAGRPKILFEAHWFSRLTFRKFDRSHPSISSRRWNRRLYARSMPGRYARLANAVALDVDAGFSSASWGAFQIMGFHSEKLGYRSPFDFALSMVESEAYHLEALVRFIEVNGLKGKLRACRGTSAESCRPFARSYNGSAYRKNRYDTRLAALIRKHERG